MQVSVDVGAGELITATKELAKATVRSLRLYSLKRHKQWTQRKIIEQIIKTRRGELPIANPSITGFSSSVVATLSANEADAMCLLSASLNSIRGQQLRCERMAARCGHYPTFKKALESFVGGSFRPELLTNYATGHFLDPGVLPVLQERDKQTKMLAKHGMEVKVAFYAGGTEALRQLIPHIHSSTLESAEFLSYEEIGPESDIRGALVAANDLFLFIRNIAGEVLIGTKRGLYRVGKLRGDAEWQPTQSNSSKDLEDMAKEYREASLKAIRENNNILAWVFFHVVAGRVIAETAHTENFEQREIVNAVLDDLRMCRAVQSQVRTSVHSGVEQSLLLTFREMRIMTSVEPEQSLLQRTSITLGTLPPVKDNREKTNHTLEPDFAAADLLARNGMKRLFSKRDRRVKMKKLKGDLNYIRFRALNTSESDIQSTSGIDAELSKSKINFAEREKDGLFFLPWNSHAIFLCWDKEHCGPSRDLYQRYSRERMMPYMLPATLLAGLDLYGNEKVDEVVTSILRGGGSILNLLEYTEPMILEALRGNTKGNKSTYISKLMSSSVTLAMTKAERAWIHREVVEYLAQVGAYNSGDVVGKSCYFDTSVSIFQTSKAPIAITFDKGTPLDGLEAVYTDREAQLKNIENGTRTAKITQHGSKPPKLEEGVAWMTQEAVHMTPSRTIEPTEGADPLLLGHVRIIQAEAEGTPRFNGV